MNRAQWHQDRRLQKFCDVLSRWERQELSAMQAGELLGCSERQFRRYRRRYEGEGLDRRLGKASARRMPTGAVQGMLDLYRTRHRVHHPAIEAGRWTVKHWATSCDATKTRLPYSVRILYSSQKKRLLCRAGKQPSWSRWYGREPHSEGKAVTVGYLDHQC